MLNKLTINPKIIINSLLSGITLKNLIIYTCVLLACLVPRYIGDFKISIGLKFSFYTLIVFVTSLLCIRRIQIQNKIESYFLFIWLIIIAFSVWRADKIGVWGYYFVWVLTAVLFQQLLRIFININLFDIIIKALVDALFLHLLMGLYEITAHRYLFETGNVAYRLYGNVAIGMFHNLNDYATFVTTIFPFSVYKFLNQQKLWEKLYYGAITIISVFLLIRSESRAAFLTLLLLSIFLFYRFYKKSKKHKRFAIGVFITLLVSLLFNPSLQQVALDFFRNNSINPEGGSDIARINLIKNGLFFLSETYGFGVGAGNLYLWLSEKSVYPIGHLSFMHNWYVEVLATFGIVFFVFYTIYHIKILVDLYNDIDKDSIWSKHNTILISFIAFSIVCISSSSNVYSEWVWNYFAWISVYCLCNCNTDSKKELVSLKEV